MVNLRATPLESVVAAGVRTSAHTYELDSLILATGFDAMIGALGGITIAGRSESLSEKWSRSIRNYLGLMPAGYPNFFTITGPASPGIFSNVAVGIEYHVDWIANCLQYLAIGAWV